jgi:hypothetical protein
MVLSADQVTELARQFGSRWPELVRAQWIIESGGGKYLSARNNLFGLKGLSGTVSKTTEYEKGIESSQYATFLNFDSQEDCVRYLVERWYKDFKGYKGVNNATSAENAARMLQSEGYATDPNYAEKLIKAMTQSSNRASLHGAVLHFQGLPHQVDALKKLDASLTAEQAAAFTKNWRNAPAAKPATPTKPSAPKFPLPVPYFYQSDSKTGQGQRMCQSSAIASRIKRIAPTLIKDDDDYLAIVNRFGDTVSQEAHRKALEHLGLKAEFRTNGSEKLLLSLLDEGDDIPIGVLHKGHVSSPVGGGHWIDIIGYDARNFHVHDPFGEMDVVNGGYVSTSPTAGRNQRYTRKNLLKRWLISSQSDGWLWIIRK